MGRVIEAFKQFFDSAGDPLSMGWLRFLEAGSNNTLKDTFYDAQYQGKNENPVRLSADGRCPDVFGRGSYRVISYENDPNDETTPGALVQVKDPVQAAVDEIATGGGGGFQAWSATETYQLLDIVTHSGIYYRSLIIDNINNTPPLEPFAWEEIAFLEVWNETIIYNEGDFVRYEENLFFSKSGANINNQPDENPVYWRRVDTEMVGVQVKTDNYSVLAVDRDNLIILGNTTIADRTFTLPIVTAAQSQFRLWFCNASDFDLTIEPGAGNDLWFDSTNEITIQKGATLELRYCSNQNKWGPQNNVGTLLGGQDIGTTTRRVNKLWVTDIETETIVLSDSLSLADDAHLYFGDSNQAWLVFDSTSTSFDFYSTENIDIDTTKDLALHADTDLIIECLVTASLTAGTTLTLGAGSNLQVNYTDHVYFSRGGTLLWDIQQDGKIVPGASNSAAWLGLSTNPIDEMHMGQNASIYFGTGDYLRIRHDGTDAYFSNNTGNMYFYNGAGVDLAFFIDPAKDCHAFQNFYVREDRTFYLGEGEESSLYYNSGGLHVGTRNATTLDLFTNNASRWEITSSGNFRPYINEGQSIGSLTHRPNLIHCRKLQNSEIRTNDIECTSVRAWAPAATYQSLEISLNYGSGIFEQTMELTDISTTVGGDLQLTIRFGGTDYYFIGTP